MQPHINALNKIFEKIKLTTPLHDAIQSNRLASEMIAPLHKLGIINAAQPSLHKAITQMNFSAALNSENLILPQLTNLQSIFENIAGKISRHYTAKQSSSFDVNLSEFFQRSRELSMLLPDAPIKNIQEKIDIILEQVKAPAPKANLRKKMWQLIEILVILMSIHQYIASFTDQTAEKVTKTLTEVEQKQELLEEYLIYIQQEVNKTTQKIQIKRSCELKLKPKKKTLIIATLQPGTEVVVMYSSKQWAYIKYDSEEGYPQAGWILKKYL
ncbi:hypothetical protein GCM10027516_33430 [Niabella aquatica]